MVRLDAESKQALTAAAELRRISVSDYVRTVTVAQARREVASARDQTILDCVDDRSKAFYQRWDFAELPGSPYRLFLSSQTLTAMMALS